MRSAARFGRRALATVAGLLLVFAAITWWALESGGVAIVETHTPEGGLRTTHVWYAEPDGELWLEAGTPENPWFQDVRRDPRLRFQAERRSGRYNAEPVDGENGQHRIRALLREKYGVRDAWVGLLVDTSRSVAVRLVPE
jgi:hypothetical protein